MPTVIVNPGEEPDMTSDSRASMVRSAASLISAHGMSATSFSDGLPVVMAGSFMPSNFGSGPEAAVEEPGGDDDFDDVAVNDEDADDPYEVRDWRR